MTTRSSLRPTALCAFAAFATFACATEPAPVVDKLDAYTGVTVTYSSTPFVFSSGETANSFPQIDVVQLGPIEINRMGMLNYYLWLGITEFRFQDLKDGTPPPFESIVLNLDDSEIRLDVAGWSHDIIGTSEPVYRKLFKTSFDAYYAIDLGQIEQMVGASEISFHTHAPDSREYTLTFGAERPMADLLDFYRVVTE